MKQQKYSKHLQCNYYTVVLSILFCIVSCSSEQLDRTFRTTAIREIPMKEGTVTQESIDGEKTYCVNFRLDEPTDCIKIGITSSYFTNTLPSKKLAAKTYFIVERAIDISRFGGNQKEVYTSMAKNFTTQWEQKQHVIICSSESDPLQRLDSSSKYRIRYTTLSNDDFQFTITIDSDCGVVIP